MASNVVLLENIDSSSLSLGPPEAIFGSSGMKSSFSKIQICLPPMRIPWDIKSQKWPNQNDYTAKLSLVVDESQRHQAYFKKFLNEVDDICKKHVNSNIKKFGLKTKDCSPLFTDTLKESDNYMPTFRTKLAVEKNTQNISTPIFNLDTQELIDPSALSKDSYVRAVVTPQHVYVINNSVGCTFKCVRIGLLTEAPEGSDSLVAHEFDFGLKS